MSGSSKALVPNSKKTEEINTQGEPKQPELKQQNETGPDKDGEGEVNQLELEGIKVADANEVESAESPLEPEEHKETDHNKEEHGETKQLALEDQKIADSGEGGSEQPKAEEHKLAEPEGKSSGEKGKEIEFQPHYRRHFPHTIERLEDIKEKLKVFNARCHKLHGRK